jgi:hypothetical protein
MPETWDGSFDTNAAAQRRDWAEKTTPEQRLAWLEQALIFAHEAGALPTRQPGTSNASPPDTEV